MKTVGLIGGMSWESTITYYDVLNKEIVSALGGFHSAKILMYSVDFAELEANMSNGNWEGIAAILADAAKSYPDSAHCRCGCHKRYSRWLYESRADRH
nr:hypothetical protein [uncultured Fibrobacter sp.]